jgi:RNA polymerase sigma factor (sigma-70 family)
MQESRNPRTSAYTLKDGLLPSAAVEGGQERRTQVSPERRLEFEDVLSHDLPRFQRVAVSWLRNAEDAEDAVQEAMLSAFKHIASFEGRARMSTWLMAILINTVRMQLRRRPRHVLLPLDETLLGDQHRISDVVADERPTPEQTFQQYELRRLLVRLTGTLPPSQRIAMQLRQRDDLSTKEMAEALGVPVGTLKAQLARGRAGLTQRMRKAIGQFGGPEQGRRLPKAGKPVTPMFGTAASMGGGVAGSETPYSKRHSMSFPQAEAGKKESRL